MTAVEGGALQSRYARISDRFKATWTSHQFASGVYAHLLDEPLPYEIDFSRIYEAIKVIGRTLNGTWPAASVAALDDLEETLGRLARQILEADARISPSMLRRFFERLKRPEDSLVEGLVRFYLYADAVEGDRRDKLDLLFTRLGEQFDLERGEYLMREALPLRQHLIELTSLLHVAAAPRQEIAHIVRAVRSMIDDIVAAQQFDDFTRRNLFRHARTFKHRIGDLYFDPDVLLAVIELNIASKNQFVRLYAGEEQRLVSDADKLMEHGSALVQNFGGANPAVVDEIMRFRTLREQFDALRAQSNVKHDVVTRLKASMNRILAHLDQGIDAEGEQAADLPPSFFREARQIADVRARFGTSEPLLEYVLRIDAAIETVDPALSAAEIVNQPSAAELRLEPWEAAAYQKLIDRLEASSEEDTEELWLLFVRAAALRTKIDEEATGLATAVAVGTSPAPDLVTDARRSLEMAKELDEQFGEFLQEAMYYTDTRILRQLYRSRFRLLRGFSGLWLIYDRLTAPEG